MSKLGPRERIGRAASEQTRGRAVAQDYQLVQERIKAAVRSEVVGVGNLAAYIAHVLLERGVQPDVQMGDIKYTAIVGKLVLTRKLGEGWVMEETDHIPFSDSIKNNRSSVQKGVAVLTDGRIARYRGNSPIVGVDTTPDTWGNAILDLRTGIIPDRAQKGVLVSEDRLIDICRRYEIPDRYLVRDDAVKQLTSAWQLEEPLTSFAVRNGIS